MFMGPNPNRRLWVQRGIIDTRGERLSVSYIIFGLYIVAYALHDIIGRFEKITEKNLAR